MTGQRTTFGLKHGLLAMVLACGVWGMTPTSAWGFGHHGWGGHFVYRPGFHHVHRAYPRFHGHPYAWHGYRSWGWGYGYSPAWAYRHARPWNWGWGYGYGRPYVPMYRGGWYGGGCFVNPWFRYSPLGCGLPTYCPVVTVPAVRTTTVFIANAGSRVVPPVTPRVWEAPAPGRMLALRPVSTVADSLARGPVPMPPDDIDRAALAAAALSGGVDAASDFVPLVRSSAADARRRAEAFMESGDKLFRQGRIADALAQYELASEAASDWGEPAVRRALAQVALQEFAVASKTLRTALRLDPRVVRGEFRLDALYHERPTDKEAHLEALATAALDRSGDAELVFLVGAWLHWDGQNDRAETIFAHAVHLGDDRMAARVALFTSGPALDLIARDL